MSLDLHIKSKTPILEQDCRMAWTTRYRGQYLRGYRHPSRHSNVSGERISRAHQEQERAVCREEERKEAQQALCRARTL